MSDLRGRAQGFAVAPWIVQWWWAWGCTAIGTLVLTVGSALLGSAVSASDGPDKAFHILSTSVVTAAGIWLLILPQRKSAQRDRLRSKAVTDFNDGLSSVHAALAQLLKRRNELRAQQDFFRNTLEGASRLFSMDGLRLCVYILDGKDDVADGELGKHLRLADHAGRNDPPRPTFEPDTEYGAALIDATVGRRQMTVSDRNASTFAIDFHDGTVWRSFFTIPLYGRETSTAGVLTVDTRDPTIFTKEDITVGWTVASLLMMGLDEVYGAAKDTEPEVSDVQRMLIELAADESETQESRS
ncbi:hypothetical protein ACMT9U_11275 [Clavibacter sp. Sh2036]|uniref:hypothetical protein n=1 Tax=Clavibacter sp. Sh2036 TaxID=3397677 RepID=UPI0039DFA28A